MKNITEIFAALDKYFRPAIYSFPGLLASRVYSPGRKYFIQMLSSGSFRPVKIPESQTLTVCGIKFNNSLFNAAGMFKKAEGYYSAAATGAGAFLAGTTTETPRAGNRDFGITHPFLPIPRSRAAVNRMGLPNPGHDAVAAIIAKLEKVRECPIGISIAADPDKTGDEAPAGIVRGAKSFEKAGVDFIEINESCPNVEHETGECNAAGIDVKLIRRMEITAEKFLTQRKRNLPVFLKFSNDTNLDLVGALIDAVVEFGFDGINFGNTSTNYAHAESFLEKSEVKKFNTFTRKIGGGVSGKPLKGLSAQLCETATRHLDKIKPEKEFAVIRTGGIETPADLLESQSAGVALNQWFTGYFEAFSEYGHRLYEEMFKEL